MILSEEVVDNVFLGNKTSKLPSEAKITNFHRTVLLNEYVCRFDVSVDHSCRVDPLDTT